MKTTTNNNQTRALMVIDQTAARIEAAHRRHPNTTPAVIILPQWTQSDPQQEQHAQEAMNAAQRGTTKTLQFLAVENNTPLLWELLSSAAADHRAANFATITAQADQTRSRRKTARGMADELQRIADKVTTPAAAKQAAAIAAAEYRREADAALDDERTLDSAANGLTYTDRADLVQEAALAYWQTGSIRMASKAVRRSVRNLAHPDAKTEARTDVWKLEDAPKTYRAAAEAANLINDPNTPADENGEQQPRKVDAITTRGERDGYLTYERREATEGREAGYYLIHHRLTVPAYISYETFATGEGAKAIARNDGLNVILNKTDKEAVDDLMTRANLNKRERQIVRYMVDQTAAEAGRKAVEKHHAQTAERVNAAPNRKAAQQIQRRADEQTEKVRSEAMRLDAMTRAGIYTKTAQEKALSRIRAKLEAAKAAPIAPTAAEQEERAARHMVSMQSNRHRESQRGQAAAVDMFAQTINRTLYSAPDTRSEDERRTAREYAAQDVVWREDYPQPQPITAAEKAAEEAAAEAKRREAMKAAAADRILLAYRRAMRDHNRRRTAYAALDALTAALVFFEAMPKAEQLEIIADITATKAAAAKAAYQAAYTAAIDKRTKAAADGVKMWTSEAKHERKQAARKAAAAAEATKAAQESTKAAAAAKDDKERKHHEAAAAYRTAYAAAATRAAAEHEVAAKRADEIAARAADRITDAAKVDSSKERREAAKMAAWAKITAEAAAKAK